MVSDQTQTGNKHRGFPLLSTARFHARVGKIEASNSGSFIVVPWHMHQKTDRRFALCKEAKNQNAETKCDANVGLTDFILSVRVDVNERDIFVKWLGTSVEMKSFCNFQRTYVRILQQITRLHDAYMRPSVESSVSLSTKQPNFYFISNAFEER